MSKQSLCATLWFALLYPSVNSWTEAFSVLPRVEQSSTSRPQTALWDASLDPLASPVPKSQVKVRKRKDLKQFTRYLEVECWKRAELRGLEPVLQAIADACKQINRIVQRAQTDDIYGAAVDSQGNPLDGTNVQGEVQQKLDVLCNTIMMRAFCGSSKVIAGVASEEEDVPRCCADVMVSRLVETKKEARPLRALINSTSWFFCPERPGLCDWRLCSCV